MISITTIKNDNDSNNNDNSSGHNDVMMTITKIQVIMNNFYPYWRSG